MKEGGPGLMLRLSAPTCGHHSLLSPPQCILAFPKCPSLVSVIRVFILVIRERSEDWTRTLITIIATIY